MSETTDCGGDVAAYVLGALEPHEADAFREHLRQCAICRDEVEALGGVVRTLPMTARQYEAPRGLKRRVMREIHREQAAAERRVLWARVVSGPRRLVAGAGAALVVAGGAVTAVVLSAGGAATVFQAQVIGISGSAQLRVTDRHGELVVRHLSAPGQGQEYEVWVQRGKSEPVPANVLFGVNSSGDADVSIPKSVDHHVTAVMVTQEPLGGTPKPTHNPVIVARVA